MSLFSVQLEFWPTQTTGKEGLNKRIEKADMDGFVLNYY